MVRRLLAKLAEQGHDRYALTAQMQLSHGTPHVSELSKEQASQLITDLKKLAGES